MTASPPRPHKVHRRRAARVGMPAKTSKRKLKFETDADYRVPRLLVLHAIRAGQVEIDRHFPDRGWFRAEFQHYDARTDNLALTYPEDGDEEVVPFDNLMNPERTAMRLSADAEAAVVLMGLQQVL